MGEFIVHHARFFDYEPKAIHCLAYDETLNKLAVSRSDGSVEIWCINNDWCQEKIIPPTENGSVEALCWCQQRLFAAGLEGYIVEYDLVKLLPKYARPSNSGAVWCLASNADQTQLAAGTEVGCVVIFDITEEGHMYNRSLDKQEDRILCLAWHSDGSIIATGGIDNIRIWNVHSGHAIQRMTLGRQTQNKETIVWNIAITSDMTIISGDSRGKTCFWNGTQGTLVKGFQSHKADVLCLCVSHDGTRVYSSGIDPCLVEFQYAASQVDSDWMTWVKASAKTQHTHDIRAVAMTTDYVITGGVDCSIVFNKLERKSSSKYWRRLPLIPQKKLVHIAEEAGLVLLQYPDYLELWRLGSTTKQSGENGETLPLRNRPVQLLHLNYKGGQCIVSSAINSQGTCISYSDSEAIRIYQLELNNSEEGIPQLSINKVRVSKFEIKPGHLLTFDPSGSKVIAVCPDQTIQVIEVDEIQAKLLHTFASESSESTVHVLSIGCKGKYFSTGDNLGNVKVFNLKKYKYVCSLPKSDHQPTAIGIHPDTGLIVVAYSNQLIYEYDITKKTYTDWSRSFSKNMNSQWLKRHSKIVHISFFPDDVDRFLLQDDQMFCIVDKREQLPSSNVKLFRKSLQQAGGSSGEVEKHCFHICQKYKHLLHVGILKKNSLIVVECSPMSLTEKLPPTLKQKKFGT